ncbi:MarR family transcriptional regulator [Streptomyces pluripotens]|uniref:MarR family transcriptional regulator n=1 Tax=Streptomyces pluripotens TaxID=1355015 RepID=A0A221NZK1_9ACTN|nr:transcriptional regulator [Streptomyces pluripotens]ARP71073.1 MarR family transcriptional regulator [Streptomyces pluripotens]ASN25322.1 MarR family transcriptional regulator [Streptomyces pluripotens]
MTGHPGDAPPALDRELHHPNRLALTAYLSACGEAEFGVLRDYCGVSDSTLSKTLSALEKTGHVRVRKGHLGKRPRTWASLTISGHRALAGHLAALEEIAATARRAGAGAQDANDA